MIMPFLHRPSMRAVLARALLLGIAAGIRSIAPLAMLARHRSDAPRTAGWRNWPLLRSRFGSGLLQAGWAGEFVMDKLPTTPSRLNPEPLAGRILLGSLAGLAIGTEGHGAASRAGGALAGAAGAVIGAYGGYHARTLAVEATGLPDPAVARRGGCGGRAARGEGRSGLDDGEHTPAGIGRGSSFPTILTSTI
jgi:uncharacterized membrane protein